MRYSRGFVPTNSNNPRSINTGSKDIVRRTPRNLADISSTPQPQAKEPSYFTSRKNILGMAAAGAVIALHFVAGLGFLWPVVAAASYGGFALLTPEQSEKKQPHLESQTPAEQARNLGKSCMAGSAWWAMSRLSLCKTSFWMSTKLCNGCLSTGTAMAIPGQRGHR